MAVYEIDHEWKEISEKFGETTNPSGYYLQMCSNPILPLPGEVIAIKSIAPGVEYEFYAKDNDKIYLRFFHKDKKVIEKQKVHITNFNKNSKGVEADLIGRVEDLEIKVGDNAYRILVLEQKILVDNVFNSTFDPNEGLPVPDITLGNQHWICIAPGELDVPGIGIVEFDNWDQLLWQEGTGLYFYLPSPIYDTSIFYTKDESDEKFLSKDGDTMRGDLTLADNQLIFFPTAPYATFYTLGMRNRDLVVRMSGTDRKRFVVDHLEREAHVFDEDNYSCLGDVGAFRGQTLYEAFKMINKKREALKREIKEAEINSILHRTPSEPVGVVDRVKAACCPTLQKIGLMKVPELKDTPTGEIWLSDVNKELGTFGEIWLDNPLVRWLAEKASGYISMNDLRGKSTGESFTEEFTGHHGPLSTNQAYEFPIITIDDVIKCQINAGDIYEDFSYTTPTISGRSNATLIIEYRINNGSWQTHFSHSALPGFANTNPKRLVIPYREIYNSSEPVKIDIKVSGRTGNRRIEAGSVSTHFPDSMITTNISGEKIK